MTVAYSKSGVPLWTNRYEGSGGRIMANAVAVDRRGKVFVTGYALNVGSSFDYTTVACSRTGERLWTNAYNGPLNNFDDYGIAVVTDNSDNVVVTGYSRG